MTRRKESDGFYAGLALFIVLKLCQLTVTLGLAFLATSIAWDFPESPIRPLLGAALGSLTSLSVWVFILGEWRGGVQFLHTAAAAAGFLFIAALARQALHNSQAALKPAPLALAALSLALFVSRVWQIRRSRDRAPGKPPHARRRGIRKDR